MVNLEKKADKDGIKLTEKVINWETEGDSNEPRELDKQVDEGKN